MRGFWALLAALLAAGCMGTDDERGRGDATTSTPDGCEGVAPGGVANRPGSTVTNQPGTFTYSGQVAAGTGKEEWAWENPSPAAQVAWSSQAGTGTFRLVLLDACGEETFQESFAAGQRSAVKETLSGAPGAWLVRVEMTAFTGQFSLAVTAK